MNAPFIPDDPGVRPYGAASIFDVPDLTTHPAPKFWRGVRRGLPIGVALWIAIFAGVMYFAHA